MARSPSGKCALCNESCSATAMAREAGPKPTHIRSCSSSDGVCVNRDRWRSGPFLREVPWAMPSPLAATRPPRRESDCLPVPSGSSACGDMVFFSERGDRRGKAEEGTWGQGEKYESSGTTRQLWRPSFTQSRRRRIETTNGEGEKDEEKLLFARGLSFVTDTVPGPLGARGRH